jgi:hypothetical protein
MDICHYAFPANLDLLLQGIGEMKAVENFKGCGSFDASIKQFIEKEFSNLNDLLKSLTDSKKPDKDGLIKVWLIACLLKTLKEQTNLTNPVLVM